MVRGRLLLAGVSLATLLTACDPPQTAKTVELPVKQGEDKGVIAVAPPPTEPAVEARPEPKPAAGKPAEALAGRRADAAAPAQTYTGLQPGSPSPDSQKAKLHPIAPVPVGAGMPPPPPDTAQYQQTAPNPVMRTAEQPVSTFSLDVDTASYANVRRFLRHGQKPPRDAVRVEELVNYFPYDYPRPTDTAEPFRSTVTVLPTPWNKDTRLLHIGIKGYDIDRSERPRLNLVFLIDVSGSMGPADRLPLLQQALRLLVEQLRPDDTVGIVTYAGRSGVLLEPTRGTDKGKIIAAIDGLGAGGSTAGAAGIDAAYRLAEAHFDKRAVNRVILGTDGDFNVGISDPRMLEQVIEDKRQTGIYLSIIGVGDNNYNDRLMQTLAQKGNGIAAYMNDLTEARKIFVDNMQSLFPIADDVKVQVEFNPAQVAEYRLIGYETRLLRREDFKNDRIDAGEVSAGHTVTAIYEITPPGSPALAFEPLRYQPEQSAAATSDEIANVRIRYKLPGQANSRLIEQPVRQALDDAAKASTEVRFAVAVAGFGQMLRGDPNLKTWDHGRLLALAQGARGEDPFGYRAEFVQLVRMLAPAGQ